MQVESIAECSPWSILQYFWPALSDNWSWKPIIGLLASGRLRQVLLYKRQNYGTSFSVQFIFLNKWAVSLEQWVFYSLF